MAQTFHQAHPTERQERHEESDVQPRPLMVFAICVIGFAIVAHIGLYYLYGLYSILPSEERKEQPRSAIAATVNVPPPRLQGLPGLHPNLPVVDMQLLKDAYDRILSTHGPSEQPGERRIPVEQAMQLLLQHGLPLPQRAGTQPASPQAAPTPR